MKNVTANYKKIIFIAVLLVAVPTIAYFYLNSIYEQKNKQRLKEVLSLRAKFASIAAEQHLKTKLKYFPSEFYNALEIYLGKNPLFDFNEYPAKDESGNDCFEPCKIREDVFIRSYPTKEFNMFKEPKYYYIKMPNKDAFIKIGNFIASDYRFLTVKSASNDPNEKYLYPILAPNISNIDKYLSYYFRDCSNSPISNLQSVLNIQRKPNSLNAADFDIKNNEGYPYSMEYKIKNFSIKKTDDIKLKGEEHVCIQALGTAIEENKKLGLDFNSEFIVKISKNAIIK